MAHRAALYTVRVRERYAQEAARLGNFDGTGVYLGEVLERYLNGFEQTGGDGSHVVRCLSTAREGDELRATMQHGENGVAADIVDQGGELQYHQTYTDTQLLRCGVLFILPRAETAGWLALHVNNNRGIKGLLEAGLHVRFTNQFEDYLLGLTPFVQAAALREAVAQDRVANVRLVKYVEPDDRAVAATDRWVHAGEWGKIEVKMSPRGRGKRLATGLLGRFANGTAEEKREAFDQIVEFQGIEFDEAKVEIILPDDTRRTFNLERLNSGHPMTTELEDLVLAADGAPSDESIFNGLRAALNSVL